MSFSVKVFLSFLRFFYFSCKRLGLCGRAITVLVRKAFISSVFANSEKSALPSGSAYIKRSDLRRASAKSRNNRRAFRGEKDYYKASAELELRQNRLKAELRARSFAREWIMSEQFVTLRVE